MAFTLKSTVVSNQDATPIVKIYPTLKGGVRRSYYGNLTITGATVGQTNAFARVPVRSRLSDVRASLASMGNGSVKIGFYRSGDGIEIKSDAITAAMALTAQARASVFDGPTPTNRGKSIADWLVTELGTAGATNDVEVDVVATVVTVSTGAATDFGLELDLVSPE